MWVGTYYLSYQLTVIKVEHLSSEAVSEGYVFPDKDDDLTKYKGENSHLMIPSGLLQDIASKYITNYPRM